LCRFAAAAGAILTADFIDREYNYHLSLLLFKIKNTLHNIEKRKFNKEEKKIIFNATFSAPYLYL